MSVEATHTPPWGKPDYCACDPLPLDEFEPEYQAEVAAAVAQETAPPRWFETEFALLPSRKWFEWHRARGRCPRCKPSRPSISDALRAAVLDRDGMVCGICGGPIPSRADLHLDHIVPVARGGPTTLANLQPAHAVCNVRKGAKAA